MFRRERERGDGTNVCEFLNFYRLSSCLAHSLLQARRCEADTVALREQQSEKRTLISGHQRPSLIMSSEVVITLVSVSSFSDRLSNRLVLLR